MEKSNETLASKQGSASTVDLAIVSRRLIIAKRFFAWVSAVYFSLSLMTAGGLFSDMIAPFAKASRLAFYFAVCTLLYSLVSYGLATAWEGAEKFRFFALPIIAVLFAAAVAHSFGFLG